MVHFTAPFYRAGPWVTIFYVMQQSGTFTVPDDCECGLGTQYNWAGPAGRLCHHLGPERAEPVLRDTLELMSYMDRSYQSDLKLVAPGPGRLDPPTPETPQDEPPVIITPRNAWELSLVELFERYHNTGITAPAFANHEECIVSDPGFYRAGPALELCYHIGVGRADAVYRALRSVESNIAATLQHPDLPFEATPLEGISERYMLELADGDREFYRARPYVIHLIMSINMFRHAGVLAHAILANHCLGIIRERASGVMPYGSHQLNLLRYYALSMNALTASMVLHLNNPDRWDENGFNNLIEAAMVEEAIVKEAMADAGTEETDDQTPRV